MASGISLGSSSNGLPSADVYTFSTPALKKVEADATSNVLAVRIKNGKNLNKRLTAILTKFEILSTVENLSYFIVKLPNNSSATTGSIWTSATKDIEYNTKVILTHNEKIIESGYLTETKVSGNIIKIDENALHLSSDNQDSEIYVVVVKNVGANATEVGVTLQWEEI